MDATLGSAVPHQKSVYSQECANDLQQKIHHMESGASVLDVLFDSEEEGLLSTEDLPNPLGPNDRHNTSCITSSAGAPTGAASAARGDVLQNASFYGCMKTCQEAASLPQRYIQVPDIVLTKSESCLSIGPFLT